MLRSKKEILKRLKKRRRGVLLQITFPAPSFHFREGRELVTVHGTAAKALIDEGSVLLKRGGKRERVYGLNPLLK